MLTLTKKFLFHLPVNTTCGGDIILEQDETRILTPSVNSQGNLISLMYCQFRVASPYLHNGGVLSIPSLNVPGESFLMVRLPMRVDQRCMYYKLKLDYIVIIHVS